jgi:hypothetical protein
MFCIFLISFNSLTQKREKINSRYDIINPAITNLHIINGSMFETLKNNKNSTNNNIINGN